MAPSSQQPRNLEFLELWLYKSNPTTMNSTTNNTSYDIAQHHVPVKSRPRVPAGQVSRRVISCSSRKIEKTSTTWNNLYKPIKSLNMGPRYRRATKALISQAWEKMMVKKDKKKKGDGRKKLEFILG